MNSSRLMNKLDDLLNPIVVKELRQAVKSRIVMAALMLFLVVQLAILLFSLWWSLDSRRAVQMVDLQLGRELFPWLQGILLGTCMLLVPAYAGIRLAAEHSDTNVDLLFISTLRPRGIIAGKLQASIVLILLIFSACAPFMTFAYLLRGIDIPTILFVLAMDFLVVLLGTQTAIFLGTVPANWTLKLLLALVGLGVLVTFFGYAMAISNELGRGWRVVPDPVAFWLVAGALAIATATATGLLFTWSVAIVSPPSCNRALPVRLYLLGFWLITGGMAAYLAYYFREPIPLFLWMDVFAVLLCVQIVTTINEREQWGLRVSRTIPRRAWLRGPAFLLYSGSAGGLLFAVLLLVLTFALPNFALAYGRAFFASPLGRLAVDFSSTNTLCIGMVALYVFNYCLTAVWLRNSLLSANVKATHTWVLALLLWGLGMALPWPILFLFQNENLNQGLVNPWWRITDPFSTIFTYVERGKKDLDDLYMLFLFGWGATVLLGCLPWMIRQMKRFRPPVRA